jgi:hypothetical protein
VGSLIPGYHFEPTTTGLRVSTNRNASSALLA